MRLIQIMKMPIFVLNREYPRNRTDINDIPPRIIWDLKSWHIRNNIIAWKQIKVLCNFWDEGQLQNLKSLDPRRTAEGLWFMECLGYAIQNDRFLPGAWPSNEVPAEAPTEGASVYDVYESQIIDKGEWGESQSKLENMILTALPAILAILHHVFIWNVSLPLEQYDGDYILYPGCE